MAFGPQVATADTTIAGAYVFEINSVIAGEGHSFTITDADQLMGHGFILFYDYFITGGCTLYPGI